jgi:hypothetical protein
MSPVYDQIRATMLAGRPLSIRYQGYDRLVCAHVIGWKNGHEQVLVFQYGGGSSSGLPISGEWRCMPISGISNVRTVDGPWRTGVTTHQKVQTCVDQVDVAVWVGADAKPYIKSA